MTWTTTVNGYRVETTHSIDLTSIGGTICLECAANVTAAVTMAKATGSVGASYGDDTHTAKVDRAEALLAARGSHNYRNAVEAASNAAHNAWKALSDTIADLRSDDPDRVRRAVQQVATKGGYSNTIPSYVAEMVAWCGQAYGLDVAGVTA